MDAPCSPLTIPANKSEEPGPGKRSWCCDDTGPYHIFTRSSSPLMNDLSAPSSSVSAYRFLSSWIAP